MKVKLVTLCPGHLNLNGDQANLKIAKRRLEWLGYEVEIGAVDKGQQIPDDAALIFLGHGSLAAWKDIDSHLLQSLNQIRSLIANGSGFMAVASGHEWAIRNGVFPGSAEVKPRISKFEIALLNGVEVLGYLNSGTSAPTIQKQELRLGTQLHGPVFAKNPNLADSFLLEILKSRGVLIPRAEEVDFVHASGASLNNNADLVAGIVDQVWDLERKLASE